MRILSLKRTHTLSAWVESVKPGFHWANVSTDEDLVRSQWKMAAFREPGKLTGTDSLVSEILGGLKLVLSKCFTIRKPENSHCTLVVTLLTTFCCSLSILHCERARDNALLQTDCLNLAESSPLRKAPYSTQVNLTVMHNIRMLSSSIKLYWH